MGCSGQRNKMKRWVVRGEPPNVEVLEAECVEVMGGWIVRAGCCTTFVASDDIGKLYESQEAAERRAVALIEGRVDD